MYPLVSTPKLDIAQVVSNNPLKNISKIAIAQVGRESSDYISRILFNISLPDLLPNFAIFKAELVLNITNIQTSNKNIFTVYVLNDEWKVDTVTWNNQPTINPTVNGASANIQKVTQCVLDVTAIIRKCYNNKIPNNGVILKNDETKNNTMVTIITDMKSSWAPVLNIYYSLDTATYLTKFISDKENLSTNGSYKFSAIRDISTTKTTTFFVKNREAQDIVAKLQVSPDGIDFVDSCADTIVRNNEIVGLVASIFGKFMRVAVKNVNSSETSKAIIWYQAQE